ncbi:hypothetical protein [Bernardetia sp. MNP-M8]|uniref:hypothetical protein n=1 Tax=Bernardetia sp. MNP-M8 TaxID=3127470 RepID=UPI0030D083D9
MQFFKSSYLCFVFLMCVSLLSCKPKDTTASGSENDSYQNTKTSCESTESTNNIEGNYTFSYKIGSEPKIEDKGKNLSVFLSKHEGKQYQTLLTFYLRYQNEPSFKIDINDESVVETMDKQYTLTNHEQVRDNIVEAKNLITVTVVDTEGKNQPFISKEVTMVDVKFDGKNLKLSIKSATLTGTLDNETVPFEFELDAKNIELTKKGF